MKHNPLKDCAIMIIGHVGHGCTVSLQAAELAQRIDRKAIIVIGADNAKDIPTLQQAMEQIPRNEPIIIESIKSLDYKPYFEPKKRDHHWHKRFKR